MSVVWQLSGPAAEKVYPLEVRIRSRRCRNNLDRALQRDGADLALFVEGHKRQIERDSKDVLVDRRTQPICPFVGRAQD